MNATSLQTYPVTKRQKFLLGIGAILALPIGLSLYVFFGTLFGFYDAPPAQHVASDIETKIAEIPNSQISPQPFAGKVPMPSGMDATESVNWLGRENFIDMTGGKPAIDFRQFSKLSLDDTLALYGQFRDAANRADVKHSTPETETERLYYIMARLLVFAGASGLSADERRQFATKSGAVLPPSTFHSGIYTGDYIRLIKLRSSAKFGFHERALRDYAKIMSDPEILAVLGELGAVTFPDHSNRGRSSNRWKIHPGEALAGFEAETLQAFHDGIDDTVFGDRRKLRRKIRKIIAAHHTADDMQDTK